MFAVSNEGTAYRSRIVDPAMLMAGKTGTSQVRIITAAERAAGVTKNEQLPWNRRDHALFVCYAPYDKPRYAVAQIVEHGGGGSAVAAPIARDILLYALYGGLPPLEAYPPEQRKAIEEQRAAAAAPPPPAPAPATRRGTGHEPLRRRRPRARRAGPRSSSRSTGRWSSCSAAVACAGFLMLYSVAGGSLEPWAEPQMIRFAVGLVGMVVDRA